jgi:hypothetical protein
VSNSTQNSKPNPPATRNCVTSSQDQVLGHRLVERRCCRSRHQVPGCHNLPQQRDHPRVDLLHIGPTTIHLETSRGSCVRASAQGCARRIMDVTCFSLCCCFSGPHPIASHPAMASSPTSAQRARRFLEPADISCSSSSISSPTPRPCVYSLGAPTGPLGEFRRLGRGESSSSS